MCQIFQVLFMLKSQSSEARLLDARGRYVSMVRMAVWTPSSCATHEPSASCPWNTNVHLQIESSPRCWRPAPSWFWPEVHELAERDGCKRAHSLAGRRLDESIRQIVDTQTRDLQAGLNWGEGQITSIRKVYNVPRASVLSMPRNIDR